MNRNISIYLLFHTIKNRYTINIDTFYIFSFIYSFTMENNLFFFLNNNNNSWLIKEKKKLNQYSLIIIPIAFNFFFSLYNPLFLIKILFYIKIN